MVTGRGKTEIAAHRHTVAVAGERIGGNPPGSAHIGDIQNGDPPGGPVAGENPAGIIDHGLCLRRLDKREESGVFRVGNIHTLHPVLALRDEAGRSGGVDPGRQLHRIETGKLFRSGRIGHIHEIEAVRSRRDAGDIAGKRDLAPFRKLPGFTGQPGSFRRGNIIDPEHFIAEHVKRLPPNHHAGGSRWSAIDLADRVKRTELHSVRRGNRGILHRRGDEQGAGGGDSGGKQGAESHFCSSQLSLKSILFFTERETTCPSLHTNAADPLCKSYPARSLTSLVPQRLELA